MMTMIISPVDTIHNLRIQKLPAGKAVPVVKAARYDRITVMIGANGQVYSDSLKNFAYTPHMWPWTEGFMKCLKRLGVITQEQQDEHMQVCRRKDAARDAEYDIKALERLSKKYGFPITKKQEQQILKRGKG